LSKKIDFRLLELGRPMAWKRHPYRQNCACAKQDGKEIVVIFLNRDRRDHYVREARKVRKQWLSQSS
jgi:hypothetical protein